jgi:arylsulfatase A
MIGPSFGSSFKVEGHAMTRALGRLFWVLGWLSMVGSIVRGAEDRPNVVLIVADDLGWADLSCYGSKFHRTPNLDKLASQGKRFTQAYSASPVCSPTRAALMTGKHPARLHLTEWIPGQENQPNQKYHQPTTARALPHEEITVAERLKAVGYSTGIIGKWHLGGSGFEPKSQGFDFNIAGDETGTPLSYLAPFRKGLRTMPGLKDAPDGQYLTDRLAIEADRFIENHKAKPFFLYLPHYAVHIPMVAKPEIVEKYAKWDGTPHGRQENPIYAAMLESLDDAVGKVLGAIDRAGLAEKTIVIFTSDNGGLAIRSGANTPPTINSPLREGKGWVYEGGIRVPLIVRWPGKIAPGVETTPVWSADLPLTIASFCGLPPARGLDGVSLSDLLETGKPLEPRPLYWHYPHYHNALSWPGGAIREADWKLVENFDTGRVELFNLAKDPSESTNLTDKEPARTREMASKLAEWRAGVGAQMPSLNPNYTANPQRPDGSIRLAASKAEVHGVMLRFEPAPHKNTLGYWVRPDDWASWEFDVQKPGGFTVDALIGCGNGSGGSVVEFLIDDQPLRFTVPVTGGFQNFVKQTIGRVSISTKGRHRLAIRAISKPGPAVMDVREVRLEPSNEPVPPPTKLTHGFLATGGETYILGGSGQLLWSYPSGSRDGWVLPDGNLLLALNKGKDHPHGAAVVVDRSGKTLFAFEGTQSEVNTVQPLETGRILLTEAGDKPRLLEVDVQGKVQIDVPLQAQTKDHHLQTRMARKLANGNYLVPQLLDKVVREYTPEGQIIWEAKTPDWPFTAIRLDNGNTLVGCTVGNLVVEFDPKGEIVWKVTNEDLPGKPISDACGVQRLPNGNTVITSYRAKGDEVKLTEVTPDKKIVWTHRDPKRPGIHHFQILEPDGTLPAGRPLR